MIYNAVVLEAPPGLPHRRVRFTDENGTVHIFCITEPVTVGSSVKVTVNNWEDQFAKIAKTTMEEVVDALNQRSDLKATFEYPGFIMIQIGENDLLCGYDSGTWDTQLVSRGGAEFLDGYPLYILAECPDVEIITLAIGCAVSRARKYAKV